MKKAILIIVLIICNLALFLSQYYSFLVFVTLCLLIVYINNISLVVSRKMTYSLLSFIFIYILLNIFSFILNTPERLFYYIIISIINLFLYSGIVWAYLSWIINKNSSESIHINEPNHSLNDKSSIYTNTFIIFVLLTIFHGIYFFAFAPGNMYVDSYSQWGQAMGGIPVDNWHPFFSTFLLRISYILSDSPILYTLLQVVGSISVFTYLSNILLKKQIRPLLVYFYIAFILFGTVTLSSMVTIYKDNIYTIALLFLSLFIFEIINTDGSWLKNSFLHKIFFIITLVFVLLSRHNGIYVVVASLLIFTVFYKKLRKIFLSLLIGSVALFLFYSGPVFDYYEVAPGSESEKYSILIQQIGSVVSYAGDITSEEEEFLEQIIPLDTWEDSYTESMADPVKFHSEYNPEFINNNEKQFLRTWWSIFKRNPLLSIKGHIEQIRPLWDINGWEHGLPGAVLYHYMIDSPKEYYDPYLQEYTFNLSSLRSSIEDYSFKINEYNLSTKPFTTTLSAISVGCLLISSLILIKKRKSRYILVLIPIFMNVGTLMLAMPAYNMRYVMPIIYIGSFSLLLPVLSVNNSQPKKSLNDLNDYD